MRIDKMAKSLSKKEIEALTGKKGKGSVWGFIWFFIILLFMLGLLGASFRFVIWAWSWLL